MGLSQNRVQNPPKWVASFGVPLNSRPVPKRVPSKKTQSYGKTPCPSPNKSQNLKKEILPCHSKMGPRAMLGLPQTYPVRNPSRALRGQLRRTLSTSSGLSHHIGSQRHIRRIWGPVASGTGPTRWNAGAPPCGICAAIVLLCHKEDFTKLKLNQVNQKPKWGKQRPLSPNCRLLRQVWIL